MQEQGLIPKFRPKNVSIPPVDGSFPRSARPRLSTSQTICDHFTDTLYPIFSDQTDIP